MLFRSLLFMRTVIYRSIHSDTCVLSSSIEYHMNLIKIYVIVVAPVLRPNYKHTATPTWKLWRPSICLSTNFLFYPDIAPPKSSPRASHSKETNQDVLTFFESSFSFIADWWSIIKSQRWDPSRYEWASDEKEGWGDGFTLMAGFEMKR